MKKGIFESISYKRNIQYSLIVILLMFVLIFKYLPLHFTDELILLSGDDRRQEQQVTLIDITRQETPIQQPVRPQIRLDDEFTQIDIVDPLLDFVTMFSAEVGDLLALPETGNSGAIVSQPDRAPRVTRIVEPVTPDGIIQSGKRFRVNVRFLVDDTGHVEEIFITEISEFDLSTQTYVPINRSEQEIAEAAMAAAIQWRFRPATADGKPVRSFSNHLFVFGR